MMVEVRHNVSFRPPVTIPWQNFGSAAHEGRKWNKESTGVTF
jgi:hypothetical protein